MSGRVAVSQGWLFQKLRWRLVRNAGTQLFGNSRVRFISMLLCSLIICASIFAAARWGFGLLATTNLPKHGGIIGLLLDSMFFILGGMLVFSTGLILYASLFTGSEAKFLLATPARADQIFATKFQSAVVFSSWAFVVLGGPILVAYGLTFDVPWYYYALLPVYFLGYVVLPGAAGAVLCLLIVNYFPRRRKQALGVLIAVLVVAAVFWAYQLLNMIRHRRGGGVDRDALDQVFSMFTPATGLLSPSRWMSRGLLALARGEPSASLFPLALLWSNALLFYLVAAFLAKRIYRRGFNRMSGGIGSRKVFGTSWLDRVMNILVGYLDPKTRLLIIKDFRTFRREPAQVGQLFLFGGLMILCVVNIRQFFGSDLPIINLYVVSLLNLSATGLLMCVYLARFVYPLISLEGRKFWILGLLPLRREQLLWGKFAFAVTMTAVLAGLIVLLSDVVLGMAPEAILIHQFTILVLALGLSGMSVGMSAWMPNFRETDPSKIVAGFGGTMFTIASLFYLGLSIVAICAPYHLAAARESFRQTDGDLPGWAYLGLPAGLLMAALAVFLPMRVGGRTLRKMEF